MMRSSISAAAVLCTTLIFAEFALAQCEPRWSNQFVPSWPAGDVLAAVNYDDDGDGPRGESVILAGRFLAAGGVSARHVVKWDGTWWSPLGAGIGSSTDINISISDMVVFDEDGPGPDQAQVWIAGTFPPASGGLGLGFAKWDGQLWSYDTVPTGTIIGQMLVDQLPGQLPSLYVVLRTGSTSSVWRRNAGEWIQIGASVVGSTIGSYARPISAMRFYDDDGPGPSPRRLVIGGSLTSTSSGTALMGIARLNGQDWESFGNWNTATDVTTLEEYDPDGSGPQANLLIAGGFIPAHVTNASNCTCIHAFDGTQWTTIGSISPTGSIGPPGAFSLRVFDPDEAGPNHSLLFMSGPFDSIVGQLTTCRGVAAWNGIQWKPANWSTYGGGRLFSLNWPLGVSSTPTLLMCRVGNIGRQALGSGFSWTLVPQQSFVNQAQGPDSPATANDPLSTQMIAAGGFYLGRDPIPFPAARWDGSEWNPLGGRSARGGALGIARADPDGVGPIPPTVIMSGTFQLPGSSAPVPLVRLINEQWQVMPGIAPGVPSSTTLPITMLLKALDSDGPGPLPPQIYASGLVSFGVNPYRYALARWTGDQWDYFPGLFDSAPLCMEVHDEDGDGPLPPSIFVGGMNAIDGVAMNGIARWDGQTWTPLVSALTGTRGFGAPNLPATALCSFDPDGPGPIRARLYAAGDFWSVDGVMLRRVAYWDGSRWNPMGDGFLISGSQDIKSMVSMDADGDGPEPAMIYVGGLLKSSGGQIMKTAARFDGVSWQALGTGTLGRPDQIVAVPRNGQGTPTPSLWIFGSTAIDGLEVSQRALLWGAPAPFFHAWPRSQSATVGGALSLRVGAGGAEPFSFQWRRDGQPLINGEGINGATTETLGIASFSGQDTGQYDCVLTNACGSAISPAANIAICIDSATPDMNADGAVNGLDISLFVEQFLSAPTSVQSICHVDLNGDHAADSSDVGVLVQSLLAN